MIKKRKINSVNLEVSELGMGTAPIGGWPKAVNEKQSFQTLQLAWEKGIRFYDTAPFYGSGMAEERLGNFLKNQRREDFIVSTKVGRLVVDSKTGNKGFKGQNPNKNTVFDFSYDGAMRSFEESLKRLKLDNIDILHLHDPDLHPDHLGLAKSGAIKAMIKLKEEKVVKAIGCGLNQNEMLLDLAQMGCFDCFLLAGRCTLLDQTSLEELIPCCKKNNITLILGGVFNSGILIEPSPKTYFDYNILDEKWYENAINGGPRKPKDFESADYWLNKAYKLRDVCRKYNISLKKAAIQFPYLNEIVASSILGMNSKNQVIENFDDYNDKISFSFWKYLKQHNLIDHRVSI